MAKKKKLKRKVQSHPTNSLATPQLPTPQEQRKILREAQNVNRGHPRKGEMREELRQINVSCLASQKETISLTNRLASSSSGSLTKSFRITALTHFDP